MQFRILILRYTREKHLDLSVNLVQERLPLGRAMLGLNKPTQGSISYGGTDLLRMTKSELLEFRRNIQIVFQDPYSSLNPRLMIGPAISEPLQCT